ncbi:MAG: SDR family NAD(P)-dependent oxidoreductase [Elusimicrobiales bacterium]
MSDKNTNNQSPIAIVGIGCLFPKAENARRFWANIKNGVDAIGDIPASHWLPEEHYDKNPKKPDMTYARRGGFLLPVDFDPSEFGLAPNALEATDSAQLLGLLAAKMALEDAGYGPDREFDKSRVSVILGVTGALELVIPLGARLGHPKWRKALGEFGIAGADADAIIARMQEDYVPWQEASFPGLLGNVVSGRIANRFNLGGTNCVVDAACGSSLGAVHMASLELAAGRSSMVVTGGVDCFNDIFMYMCFSKTPALSASGDAKPFDASADGTALGEGLGMMVMKRLDDAVRDGDRIYSVIKGVGSSSDGKGKAIYAPSAEGQARALRNAYAAAGVEPSTVELAEAHGTGTTVGDGVELDALTEVYRENRKEGTWCALGSVKSMIGHTKAAAGSAGLIKASLALYNKTLPPSIKVTAPLQALAEGTTPFYLNAEPRPWLKKDHPRRAGVSALGFGGSNFHAVLEEYSPEKKQPDWDGDAQLAVFSGNNPGEIKQALSSWKTLDWDGVRLAAMRARAAFRPSAPARLAFVLERGTDWQKTVDSALAGLDSQKAAAWATPDGVQFSSAAPEKLAVLFPGQGAQYPGMQRDLACRFPESLAVLTAADAQFGGEKPLSDYLYPRSAFTPEARQRQAEDLKDTRVAQPALGAAELGAWRALAAFGLRPAAFAGHSYGELTALCAAGVYGDAEFFALSKLRGALMAAGAGDRGGMIAVQAPLADVEKTLAEEKLDLIVANKNTPAQFVLSGATAEIKRAAERLAARGLKATVLQVSAAFHSPLVSGARQEFAAGLEQKEFRQPQTQVYANKTAAPYPADPAAARALLASQLASPVEFTSMIERMHADGVRVFLEVGPGARLTGMVSAILAGRDHTAFALDASAGRKNGVADMARALARLAALGCEVSLSAWEGGEAGAKDADRRISKLAVKLTGAGYRSPRPAGQKPAPRRITAAPAAAQQGMAPAPQPRSPQPFADEALRITQESMAALQKMQEQTAVLHARFLEGQEAAQRSFQALIDQQRAFYAGGPLPQFPQPLPAAPAVQAARPVQAPVPPPAPAAGGPDVAKVLLEIVSAQTGYPAESLNTDMDMESDLGIDSIKRVAILSELQEKLPDAPRITPEQLGTIRTLRQVAAHLSAGMPAPAVTQAPAQTGGADISKVLLEIVSAQTGYPAGSLNTDMDMESDLGIDSIKRVAILSELQEKLPGAPRITPEQLGTIRTLRQVIAHLSAGTAPAAAPQPKAAPAKKAEADVITREVLKAADLDPAAARERLAISKDHPFLVTDDGSELSDGIVGALNGLGCTARKVPVDFKPEGPVSGLIILAPAARLDQKGFWPADSETFLKKAFHIAQAAGPALRETGKNSGACLMTVSRLDGAFGLSGLKAEQDPVFGGLAGLAKTAAREWPEVSCRAVDAAADWDHTVSVAQAVAEEVFFKGPSELGLSATGSKVVLLSASEQVKGGKLPLEKGDVVLITGGARGVTAEAAAALAKACAPALAILGRSPKPAAEEPWLAACASEADIKRALIARNPGMAPKAAGEQCRALLAAREIRAQLNRFEAAGSRAAYYQADIRDAASVQEAVEQATRELGPVRGLVHGAGVLADKLIQDKTEEQFDSVFDTKVAGLRHVLSALDLGQLKTLALYSSSTARFGRTGQCDYAMANEALNKAARLLARRLPACRVASFNWGPWDGGMVNDGLKALFAREGVGVIGLEEGGRFLADELSSDSQAVEVVVVARPAGSAAPRPPQGGHGIKLEVSVEDYPVLRSHVINGKAVVPTALIAEWLAHAALHENPGLAFHGFDGLKIFKGVILSDGRRELTASAAKAERRDGLFRARAELRGPAGELHAGAEIVMAFALPPADAPRPDFALKPYPRPAEQAYGEILFHGEDMRFVRAVAGVSEKGIVLDSAVALPPSSWARRPLRDRWLADPAALDAAFQGMILWTFENSGACSLPNAAASYRQFARFPEDGVRVAAHVTASAEHSARADIDFIDGKGALVARMEGYECTVDKSLNEAFRRTTTAC